MDYKSGASIKFFQHFKVLTIYAYMLHVPFRSVWVFPGLPLPLLIRPSAALLLVVGLSLPPPVLCCGWTGELVLLRGTGERLLGAGTGLAARRGLGEGDLLLTGSGEAEGVMLRWRGIGFLAVCSAVFESSLGGRGGVFECSLDGRGGVFECSFDGRGGVFESSLGGRGGVFECSFDGRGGVFESSLGGRGGVFECSFDGRGGVFESSLGGRGGESCFGGGDGELFLAGSSGASLYLGGSGGPSSLGGSRGA